MRPVCADPTLLDRIHNAETAYPEEMRIRQQLRNARQAFAAAVNSIITIAEEDATRAELLQAQKSLESVETYLQILINEAIAHENDELIERHDKVDAAIKRSLIVTTSVVLLAFLVTILANALLARQVIRRLLRSRQYILRGSNHE